MIIFEGRAAVVLSVIIATQDSERALVPTLAALVSGATAGLISEVLVADGGSRDDTAAVAEVAGCNFMVMDGMTTAQRLKGAAAKARAPWLLFLRPGTILDEPWIRDAQRFMERTSRADSAAVFRRGAPTQSSLRDALSQIPGASRVQLEPARADGQGWDVRHRQGHDALRLRQRQGHARQVRVQRPLCGELAGAACFRRRQGLGRLDRRHAR